MSKIVLIHPQAGVDWQSNSAIFAVELARRLDNYFEVVLLSGGECGSFSRPINSLASRSSGNKSLFKTAAANRWFERPQTKIRHLTSFLPCLNYLLNNPADLLLPLDGYSSLFIATCIRSIRQTPILSIDCHHRLSPEADLRRSLSLRPDRLITLNPMTTRQVRMLAPNQIVETIPFGIDPAEFTPEGKAIATGLPKPCIMLSASLDRHNKQRIELVIKAVARIPEASLLICGEGADRDYFQSMGERLLGRQRCQVRAFAYAQMPQVYRSANLFTSAAKQAPYGLKYVEAMACGLPVVTADNKVSRYLVGNAGIFCDVTDLDKYAKSLKLALAKHWYQRQPRQNALRFSWQGITLLYYQAVLKTIACRNQLTLANTQPSIRS